MHKKYALIFAKTPRKRTPYDTWLSNSGITPIILTSLEYYDGYKHLAHVYAFDNYDANHLVEKKAYELGRQYSIVCIFARAESDLIRAAYLRQRLNISGQSVESALGYRNKVLMKNYLDNDKSLLIPSYKLIESTYDILDFIDEHAYPVVIKPILESGSSGVNIISKESELNKFLSKSMPFGQMEIEEYVEGDMYHIDGLIVNGEIVCIQPFKYINTCLSFLKNEYAGSCTISPNNSLYSKLIDKTLLVIEKLPKSKNMTFHAEFWVTQNSDIIFCEIASRTGGGMISFIFKHALKIDLDEAWFLSECGIQPALKFNYQPSSCVSIPPFNAVLKHLPKDQEPDYIIASHYCGEAGRRYYGGVKSGLFLAGYVVDGNTEDEAQNKVLEAAKWYYQNTVWETINEQ